jgi:hypothetical protein
MIIPFSLLFTYVIHPLSSSLFILSKAKDAFDDRMDRLMTALLSSPAKQVPISTILINAKGSRYTHIPASFHLLFPMSQDNIWKSDTKTHT